jgi:Holliday junction resolvase RusA-like endonuclease
MHDITFDVVGEPKSQPRVKAMRCGGFIRIYTPATAKEWKGAVAKAAAPFLSPEGPLTGPLYLTLLFRFARPKSHLRTTGELTKSAPRQHTQKPDADNLAKAVMDALTDCGLWADDTQVVRLNVCKTFVGSSHDPGGEEGCTVHIEHFNP